MARLCGSVVGSRQLLRSGQGGSSPRGSAQPPPSLRSTHLLSFGQQYTNTWFTSTSGPCRVFTVTSPTTPWPAHCELATHLSQFLTWPTHCAFFSSHLASRSSPPPCCLHVEITFAMESGKSKGRPHVSEMPSKAVAIPRTHPQPAVVGSASSCPEQVPS